MTFREASRVAHPAVRRHRAATPLVQRDLELEAAAAGVVGRVASEASGTLRWYGPATQCARLYKETEEGQAGPRVTGPTRV